VDDTRWCRAGTDGNERRHDAFQEWVVRNLNEAGGFIFGRRTYEAFAGHWPNAPKEEQAVADPLNKQPKYVASHTLSEPLEW